MNKQKLEEIGDEFVGLLKEYAVESGKELTNDLKEVRDYVASRMPHIAAAVGEKGFAEALKAERDKLLAVKTMAQRHIAEAKRRAEEKAKVEHFERNRPSAERRAEQVRELLHNFADRKMA